MGKKNSSKKATTSAVAETPAPAPVVALPPRNVESNAVKAPVWSLEPEAVEEDVPVPLAAKCSMHDVERTICCRELKGEDDRSLISPDVVKDIVIGFSDGITVPFALTAGLSGLGSSKIVTVAGVAELVSGAISMGVGGFLSAQAERDHYRFLKLKTRERVTRSCAGEMEREVAAVLSPLGIDEPLSRRVAGSLLTIESSLPPPPETPSILRSFLQMIRRDPKFSSDSERQPLIKQQTEEEEDKGLTAFLLKFGEGLEETTDSRLWISALTIGASYFFAGLIPLLPYFFFEKARTGLIYSVVITSLVLLLFGAAKQYYSGAPVGVQGYAYGSVSMLFVGGSAAAASFGIVKALEGGGL